ncbi:MAG: hypothetical protein WD423_00260 [Rhodothermales bacterium]
MDQDFIRSHLEKSDFSPVQADGLSQILADMATKDDLQLLKADLTSEMRQGFAQMRAEMHKELATFRIESVQATEKLRSDLSDAILEIQASTLRWVIALIIALTSIVALLEVLIE